MSVYSTADRREKQHPLYLVPFHCGISECVLERLQKDRLGGASVNRQRTALRVGGSTADKEAIGKFTCVVYWRGFWGLPVPTETNVKVQSFVHQ